MKGSVSRYCEPVSQGPLVPGHTDDWVFKLSRRVILVPEERKAYPNREAVLRALNPESSVTRNNEVSFPTFLVLRFLCLVGTSLLISILSTVHYKWWNSNQGWVYNLFSKRVDPEVLVFSVFYSMNTRISTTQSLGPTICILLYLLYLTSLHISVHSKFHIILLCISK